MLPAIGNANIFEIAWTLLSVVCIVYFSRTCGKVFKRVKRAEELRVGTVDLIILRGDVIDGVFLLGLSIMFFSWGIEGFFTPPSKAPVSPLGLGLGIGLPVLMGWLLWLGIRKERDRNRIYTLLDGGEQ